MRLYRSFPQGSSLEIASFFMNRSLTSRMLMLGLPLLAGVLLLIFMATGDSIEDIVDHAIARNAQLQSQAMRLALEQTLEEARNQLLILAAGSMDSKEMASRLKFRAKAEGLRYRELAFEGIAPDDKYLLLNFGGDIINVPIRLAQASPTGPFHSMAVEQRPGHVSVGQPVEAAYSMVPIQGSAKNVILYVLRFTTPVYDADGNFNGYLMLSLDLRELRDIISTYSAPDAPIVASGNDVRVSTLFFDREGWMLFQSETPDAALSQKSLSTDVVRTGFMGDFGRPGFNTAFRPSPEHINYWDMVTNVQDGRAGQLPLAENGTLWSNNQLRVERVSYVPVSFRPVAQGAPVVLGGLAVLDTSFATTRTGMQLMGIYASSFGGGMLLLGLSLWWLARNAGKSLNAVTEELERRNAAWEDEDLEITPLPHELERLKNGINILLRRLRHAKTERRIQEEAEDAIQRRKPLTDLPHPEDLPASGLVGSSPAMLALYDNVRKAAQVLADVLVVGETGTGKELVSEAIHRLSARGSGPFITINCGALDENLLMDTLFGHVKGAFTEARAPRKGAFLTAQGGTLMLDEVGNAAPKVQQALLRALSTRKIRPLGSDQDVPFDTRIIAATNAALLEDAKTGSFREDLYYRLAVITINTPPLRERKTDIPSLTVYFLHEALKARVKAAAEKSGRDSGANITAHAELLPQVSQGAMAKLMDYDWPGNVRELRNSLTRALTFCEGRVLYEEDIQLGVAASPPKDSSGNDAGAEQTPDAASHPQPAQDQHKNSAFMPSDMGAGAVPGRSADPMQITANSTGDTANERSSANSDCCTEVESVPPKAAPQANLLADLMRSVGGGERLNPRLIEAWPHIAALGGISRQEYQFMAGKDISMRTAQYDLQLLVRLGLVRKEGRGPAQRYVVIGRIR